MTAEQLALVEESSGPIAPPAPGAGLVYFVRAGEHIKIGKTRQLYTRMLQLQRKVTVPIELLATVEGYTAKENELHARFADLREHGEWFRATPALEDFVASVRGDGPAPSWGTPARAGRANHVVICEVCGARKEVFRASTEPTPRTCSRRCNGIRNAALTLEKRAIVPMEVRFFAKTCPEPNTGCLLWTGAVEPLMGYGAFWLGRDADGRNLGNKGAHVVAFFLAHGRWPHPKCLHKCDTPACAEPTHLFEGTQLENLRDMCAKGRHWAQQVTHCPQGHPYDEANTKLWRNRRYCRACGRANGAERKARIKAGGVAGPVGRPRKQRGRATPEGS